MAGATHLANSFQNIHPSGCNTVVWHSPTENEIARPRRHPAMQPDLRIDQPTCKASSALELPPLATILRLLPVDLHGSVPC